MLRKKRKIFMNDFGKINNLDVEMQSQTILSAISS